MKRINYNKGFLWENYKITCNHCGSAILRPVWWLKLLFIFKRRLYFVCDECHSTSCYISFFNMIHDTTDEKEKELNKLSKWDSRVDV